MDDVARMGKKVEMMNAGRGSHVVSYHCHIIAADASRAKQHMTAHQYHQPRRDSLHMLTILASCAALRCATGLPAHPSGAVVPSALTLNFGIRPYFLRSASHLHPPLHQIHLRSALRGGSGGEAPAPPPPQGFPQPESLLNTTKSDVDALGSHVLDFVGERCEGLEGGGGGRAAPTVQTRESNLSGLSMAREQGGGDAGFGSANRQVELDMSSEWAVVGE